MYTALTPPDGTHAIILAAAETRLSAAVGYLIAKGARLRGLHPEILSATSADAGATSPLSAHFVRASEIGPMFIGQPIPSDTLKTTPSNPTIWVLGPEFTELFLDEHRDARPIDLGPRLTTIVVAARSFHALGSAKDRMAAAARPFNHQDVATRHLIIVDALSNGEVADDTLQQEVHALAKDLKFAVTNLPVPPALLNLSDASFSKVLATDGMAGSDLVRRVIALSRWVRESIRLLIQNGAIPACDLPMTDLDLVKR